MSPVDYGGMTDLMARLKYKSHLNQLLADEEFIKGIQKIVLETPVTDAPIEIKNADAEYTLVDFKEPTDMHDGELAGLKGVLKAKMIRRKGVMMTWVMIDEGGSRYRAYLARHPFSKTIVDGVINPVFAHTAHGPINSVDEDLIRSCLRCVGK